MAARTKTRPFRLTLFTPGIPWYRDVRVLRVLAQVVFVILLTLALYVLFANLVTNLQESNLALDFAVYKRPFNVAISDGISLTEPWLWTTNTDALGIAGFGALVLATAAAAFGSVRRIQAGGSPIVLGGLTVILLLLTFTNPPAVIGAWLTTFFKDYFYPNSIARAFVTGVLNTLQVVLISVVASTVLGVLAGIGLLSRNFLLRTVTRVYVEIFRNTPLVVQLVFIYRSLTLLLPAPRQSLCSLTVADPALNPCTLPGNLLIMNARGVYVPALIPTESSITLWLVLLVGVVASVALGVWRRRVQESTGKPARLIPTIGGALLLALVAGWLIAGTPYTVNTPFLKGPNVQEGTQLTIGFIALVLGLTLYTGAFIADIVRAGIQSVAYGQIEAARSQGFSGGQVLSLVVLPQALRLIIPPLGNQYVGLGKNSSLALVVSFVDTYRIAQLSNNESGQAVPFFVLLMLLYLALSLTLSFVTNLFNQSTQLRTR
ncbi:MAG: ABC transporter permease subunit [Armatimonadetes bacterium]|nr:ABC transporter permease subunit [Anaerolineae bacterium]